MHTSPNILELSEQETLAIHDYNNEGRDNPDIVTFEDDLCVGVRRRALYDPIHFRGRKRTKRYSGESIPETNINDEDSLRALITVINGNIASLNRFNGSERQATATTDVALLHGDEEDRNDVEEYAYYTIRSQYTIRAILQEGTTVLNTIQDRCPRIRLHVRAYRHLKNIISALITNNKWKVRTFGVVSVIITVYFALSVNISTLETPLIQGNARPSIFGK